MEKNNPYHYFPSLEKSQLVQETEKILFAYHTDLFLKSVHRQQNEERVLALIDEALDGKDFERCRLLVNELEQLRE